MKKKSRFIYSSAAVFLAALLLVGCGPVRYPQSYTLSVPRAAPRSTPAPEALGTLAIREFRCPDYLCEGRIVYRPSEEEVGFYDYHRWATNPRQAITQSIADTLTARSLFTSVAVQESGIEPTYVLSGKIERLEEVDRGRDVRAVCTLSAQLLDARTRSVVWTRRETESVPVESRNMAGVVSSLSAAARVTVDRLVESMERELASAEASK